MTADTAKIREHLRNIEGQDGENTHLLRNFRRLFRSQIYCITAVIGGSYLLITASYWHQWPSSFVTNWTSVMDYLFSSSVAHWIISILEDLQVGHEVYRSTHLPTEYNLGLYLFFIIGLISHHLFAIFVYNWCLFTHHLSGLAVLGCLYEIPVLLLNYREMSLNFPHLSLYKNVVFTSRTSLTTFWSLLHFTWHGTRTIGCLLYLLSLILWRRELAAALPLSSLIVYHLLGIGFSYINVVLLLTVLMFYITGDYRRISDSFGDTRGTSSRSLERSYMMVDADPTLTSRPVLPSDTDVNDPSP